MTKAGLLFVFTLLTQSVNGQRIDTLAWQRFDKAATLLRESPMLRHGTLGVVVQAVQTGEILWSLNPDKSLPSASTLKLVTTAAALELLKPDFTYRTFLEYDGTLSDGTLNGNLYVRGTGDPTLGSSRFPDQSDSCLIFSQWLTALRQAGIRDLRGSVVTDPSYFDSQSIPESWIWGDIGNYYGAGVSGLNWGENSYRLYFRTGATGQPARLVSVTPPLVDGRFINQVTTGTRGSGDETVVLPDRLPDTYLITGTIPPVNHTFSIRGAVRDPGRQLAHALTAFLKSQGMAVTGSPAVYDAVSPSSPRKQLHVTTSPGLPDICRQTNLWSVNLYADALLKTIGKFRTGKPDYPSAVEALGDFWKGQGVDLDGFYIKDGSGLSPSASLTPKNLTDILTKATTFSTFPSFQASMAVAGVSGTVRNKRFGTRKNVYAKSGSIEGTRAYAGYVRTRSGDLVAFALIAHKYLPNKKTDINNQLIELVNLLSAF